MSVHIVSRRLTAGGYSNTPFKNTVQYTQNSKGTDYQYPEYTLQNTVQYTGSGPTRDLELPEYTLQNTVQYTRRVEREAGPNLNTPFKTRCNTPR
jgi:hypothetical protein